MCTYDVKERYKRDEIYTRAGGAEEALVRPPPRRASRAAEGSTRVGGGRLRLVRRSAA